MRMYNLHKSHSKSRLLVLFHMLLHSPSTFLGTPGHSCSNLISHSWCRSSYHTDTDQELYLMSKSGIRMKKKSDLCVFNCGVVYVMLCYGMVFGNLWAGASFSETVHLLLGQQSLEFIHNCAENKKTSCDWMVYRLKHFEKPLIS